MSRFYKNIDNANNNLVCGNVADELREQDMVEEPVGGFESKNLGNKGGACSLTLECQNLCNIVNYSGWGPWCK